MSRTRSWGRLQGWVPWDRVKRLGAASSRPGVYLLAHFDDPPLTIDTKDKRIVYIGETCDTLRSRWQRFDQAAFHGRAGHAGGVTYFRVFRGKHRERLFVALATPSDNKVVLPFRIRYLERRWLLDFVLAHGRPPRCNRE